MEDYGTIESGIVEPPAAPPKKLRGRKMIAAVAALALVVVGAAVEIKFLRGPTHGLICAQVPKARCAKPLNGLTDCTDLCRKFPNAGHTTTCCKCYPAC